MSLYVRLLTVTVILTVQINASHCAILDDDGIKALKWADGVIAAIVSLLWVFRQTLLTQIYNGAYLAHIRFLYYTNIVLSVAILIVTVAFIVPAAVLSAFSDAAYPNTLVVFVGFAIPVALEKRRQFDISYRVKLIHSMLAKDKFRVGYQTIQSAREATGSKGLFMISKKRIPQNATLGQKWSGTKYKVGDKFYIEDWGVEHRIYGMDTENFAKHVGKYGTWRDSLLEASLSIGWLPSHYINEKLLKYLIDHARKEASIMTSIPTWKGQIVNLNDVNINNLPFNTKNVLGLYTLAIMETPEKARKWFKIWEQNLAAMYNENYKYENNANGDVKQLDNKASQASSQVQITTHSEKPSQ